MNKKGISLVALVITIIVLIILTGAVVITGVNVPQGGQQAVTDYNFGMVQDAVTLYIMNEISEDPTKTVETIMGDLVTSYATENADTVWKDTAVTDLNLSGVTLNGVYNVTNKGLVSVVEEDEEEG